MIYRGINKADDIKNGGRIIPKGNIVAVTPRADGKCKHDGTFKHGPCESNTARAQQIESGLYGGCGISTSRSEKIAIRFATTDFNEDGYVYVIDETMLERENVVAYEFGNSLNSHEHEVTLIPESGGALPECLIVEKYAVNSDGNKI